ncbi:hypothetical protein [Nonlabens sp. MB-3u-79]|uniref:hypothetical protein n=1 Tax=Nonlabens sp. MB-3u-79 TaxID=2058134 RepID=UPI0012FD73C5|nr:hypothetical protein [Nonlabens sp. MB-3u-79]
MLAKLEKDIINVYNEKDILIGGIKTQSNYKNADIIIGESKYQLTRDKWNTKILENGDVKYNLKSNSFSGNTEVLETGRKITGVFGLKWGTKMIDNQKNILIKIRNESQFIDKKKYEIEISDNNVTDLEILMTLYGHLYGSNMKVQAVVICAIAGTGAMIWLT